MKIAILISIIAAALGGCQTNPAYEAPERGASYMASSKPSVAYTPEQAAAVRKMVADDKKTTSHTPDQARKIAEIRENNARIHAGYQKPRRAYRMTDDPTFWIRAAGAMGNSGNPITNIAEGLGIASGGGYYNPYNQQRQQQRQGTTCTYSGLLNPRSATQMQWTCR